MNQETGKYLLWIGAGIFLLGIVIYFFHDKLNWIGRLPGDFRIEKDNTRIYIPVTTMLLFSVVLSLVIYLVRKFF